jgi:hypothetical protein
MEAKTHMNLNEFSLELTTRTMEANRDFIKCSELRAFLDENAELLQQSSHTLGYSIARSIVNSIAGLDRREDLSGYGSAEVIHREYKNVLADFIGEDTSPVIKLLAQRAAVCWLRVQQAEQECTAVHSHSSIPIHQLDAVDRQLTRAQGRFLRACDALARMRAMLLATEALREKVGKPARPKLALASNQQGGAMAKSAKPESEKIAERLEKQAREDPLAFRMMVLAERANRSESPYSDEAVELRKFFDDNPGIWRRINSIADSARRQIQVRVIGNQPGNVELLEREYKDRRDKLGWQEAGELERLLIERVLLCWLRLLWAENYAAALMRPEVRMKESLYAEKLLAGAHSRYVKACESLAKMRAMALATDLLREKAGKPERAEKRRLALASAG